MFFAVSKILRCEHWGFYLFWFVVISILGHQIKPQVFILTIAMFCTFLMRISLVRSSDKKKIFMGVTVGLLGAATSFAVLYSAHEFCGFELDAEKKLGMTHFMMMGLNEEFNGVWVEEDVAISMSYSNKTERKIANLIEVKNRIKKKGVKGLGEHLINKTLVNYNDGTFAWGIEGGFWGDSYAIGNKAVIGFLQSFFYHGENQHYYEGFM